MIHRYPNVGLAYFDQDIINRYGGEIDDKYFRGNMQKKRFERTKREIDRSTMKVKRVYAIMMLGTVLAPQACDVIILKLADICRNHVEYKKTFAGSYLYITYQKLIRPFLKKGLVRFSRQRYNFSNSGCTDASHWDVTMEVVPWPKTYL